MIGTSELSAVSSVLIALAVIIGGGWTLYKFGIQRARESFISLELDATDSRLHGQHRNLILKLKAVNIGKTGIGKKLAWIEVFPLPCPTTDVEAIQSPQLPKDALGRRFVIFDRNSYLEPGEEFADMLLLEIPADISYLLIRIIFSGRKRGQTWHARHVVPVASGSSSAHQHGGRG